MNGPDAPQPGFFCVTLNVVKSRDVGPVGLSNRVYLFIRVARILESGEAICGSVAPQPGFVRVTLNEVKDP